MKLREKFYKYASNTIQLKLYLFMVVVIPEFIVLMAKVRNVKHSSEKFFCKTISSSLDRFHFAEDSMKLHFLGQSA